MWSNEETNLFPPRYQKLIKWHPFLVYFCQELKRFEPAVACLQWFIDVNTWQPITLSFNSSSSLKTCELEFVNWVKVCCLLAAWLWFYWRLWLPRWSFANSVGSWSVNEKLYVFTDLLLAVFNSSFFSDSCILQQEHIHWLSWHYDTVQTIQKRQLQIAQQELTPALSDQDKITHKTWERPNKKDKILEILNKAKR